MITGHTGFKGAWLTAWLNMLGAKVTGVSIDLVSEPSHFSAAHLDKHTHDIRLDIRDSEGLKKIITEMRPDFIFHLAASAYVPYSFDHPLEVNEANAIGTLNILDLSVIFMFAILFSKASILIIPF